MIEILNILLLTGLSFLTYWLYVHYRETLKMLDLHSYYIDLLDYNNLTLDLNTREEGPSLEEETLLINMEHTLKVRAEMLGLHVPFPERPLDPD